MRSEILRLLVEKEPEGASISLLKTAVLIHRLQKELAKQIVEIKKVGKFHIVIEVKTIQDAELLMKSEIASKQHKIYTPEK